jgi:hypothetical protein
MVIPLQGRFTVINANLASFLWLLQSDVLSLSSCDAGDILCVEK